MTDNPTFLQTLMSFNKVDNLTDQDYALAGAMHAALCKYAPALSREAKDTLKTSAVLPFFLNPKELAFQKQLFDCDSPFPTQAPPKPNRSTCAER